MATPIEGVPIPMPEAAAAEKSGGFLRWPSPKALAAWLALLLTVTIIASAVGGAFFVKKQIYDTDKAAQQVVNAKVDTAQATVTVEIGGLKKQIEEARTEVREQRAEYRTDMRELKESVNTLVRRSR